MKRRTVGSIRGDDEPAGRCARGPDEPDGDEDPVAPEALQDGTAEHARDDRGDHPDGAEEPGREGAFAVVDEHEEHDQERGVGGDAEHPVDLEAADAVVRHRVTKRRDGLPDCFPQSAHRPRMARPAPTRARSPPGSAPAVVVSQSSTTPASVTSPTPPEPRTTSWKARMSKASPRRASASARRRRISSWPTL